MGFTSQPKIPGFLGCPKPVPGVRLPPAPNSTERIFGSSSSQLAPNELSHESFPSFTIPSTAQLLPSVKVTNFSSPIHKTTGKMEKFRSWDLFIIDSHQGVSIGTTVHAPIHCVDFRGVADFFPPIKKWLYNNQILLRPLWFSWIICNFLV